MPNFMPKEPLAHALLALPAMLSIVAAHPRYGSQWVARRAGFTPDVLTRHCSGSATPPTELFRQAARLQYPNFARVIRLI